MIPFLVLVVVTLLARLAGRWGVAALSDWPASVRAGLAAMFLLTASAHFNSMRADLVRMIPPWVPAPEAMVAFTGLCEIAGAVGLLLPRTRKAAALALIVFMLAIFPANVHAALTGVTLGGRPPTPLVPRTAMQVVFIAAIWWSGIRRGNVGGKES